MTYLINVMQPSEYKGLSQNPHFRTPPPVLPKTQIQRIQCKTVCVDKSVLPETQIYVEEGIKLIFGPPVKIVQNSNGQRLPLELTLGVIKRVNYHIVPG